MNLSSFTISSLPGRLEELEKLNLNDVNKTVGNINNTIDKYNTVLRLIAKALKSLKDTYSTVRNRPMSGTTTSTGSSGSSGGSGGGIQGSGPVNRVAEFGPSTNRVQGSIITRTGLVATVEDDLIVNGKVSIGKSTFEDWAIGTSPCQFGGNSAVWADAAEAASTTFTLAQNAYQSGENDNYVSEDEASSIRMYSGTIRLQVAASGEEDAQISWTTAVLVNNNGTTTLLSGSKIGNLTFSNGSIIDSSGAISFGNENLSTTGTLASGTITVSSDLVLATGSITSASGAISFGNENLLTTGTIGAAQATFTKVNLGGGLTVFVLNGVSLNAIVGATSQIATELQYVALQHSNVAAAGSRFMLSRSRGTLAAPTIVQNNDAIAAIDAAVYDGTDYVLAGQIDFEADGVIAGNTAYGRFVIKTSNGGVLPAARWTVSAAGHLLSGTDGTGVYNVQTAGALSCAAITSSGNIIADGGNIGITGDTDLLTLAANLLTVTGSTSGATLRIQTGSHYYTIGRNTATGDLEFIGNQGGYSNYSFNSSNLVPILRLLDQGNGVFTGDVQITGNGIIDSSGSAWISSNGSGNTTLAGTLQTAGTIYINETANTEMTTGITINQGSADNEIAALKSSDIGQPFTDPNLAESDTFCDLKKQNGNLGGYTLRGFSESGTSTTTADISAYQGLGSTTIPAIRLFAATTDGGTSYAALADGNMVLAVRNFGTDLLKIYGNGDTEVTGQLAVNMAKGSAQFAVDQSSTTAAIPVNYWDQADVDQPWIQFASTIGAGNCIEAVGGKTLTTTHFLMVELPGGLTRYIPCGTIA